LRVYGLVLDKMDDTVHESFRLACARASIDEHRDSECQGSLNLLLSGRIAMERSVGKGTFRPQELIQTFGELNLNQ
jgi:hypothetical protein